MAISYAHLKSRPFPDVHRTYGPQDTMLYALSLGLGQDPLDPAVLPYVYEGSPDGLRALPTQAAVLGYPGFWAREADTGIAWQKLLHGEQRLRIHRPLPAEGHVVGRNRITHVTDKGEGRGAVLVIERQLSDEAGELLATLQQITFCRGDGGYSALTGGQPSDEPLPALAPVPQRQPEHTEVQATRPEAALFYRLLADPNPLHADPEVARGAGFERPILHGMASYGMACWAVLRSCAGGEAARLRSFDCRFAAPVFPGETLHTDIWRDGATVRFQTRVAERNQVVISHGLALLAR